MLELRLMPPNILAFHTDFFQSINGQGILREALERHAISAVFLLHEFGDPEYESNCGFLNRVIATGESNILLPNRPIGSCTRPTNLPLPSAVNG